jgi:hypothetical protein
MKQRATGPFPLSPSTAASLEGAASGDPLSAGAGAAVLNQDPKGGFWEEGALLLRSSRAVAGPFAYAKNVSSMTVGQHMCVSMVSKGQHE